MKHFIIFRFGIPNDIIYLGEVSAFEDWGKPLCIEESKLLL